ncbi:GNAT family N-acetyltransferase [Ktedonosporobacter rubrisoli]|uniref:GNAT family N-acetyltransferase n=1 Tax=Ktedonosporobacter rubrisoli TaxID=2509675 RepID=A0A4P6JLX4_KTERU|nr:GNAT family N-acetyltransferase [Ktedonosporobacter rubrisoli]QBD75666.1 GNAT family N-acetyltransferase [Ktedonosporobacter rubrisoli]
MAFLTTPAVDYRDSYLKALSEFQEEGRQKEIASAELASNFTSFVQQLRTQADRNKLEPGQVPCSEFWLVEGNEYLGRLLLRHELNERLRQKGGHIGYAIRPSRRKQGYGKLILKHGLEQAKISGLKRVLLTSDKNNHSSRAIIESNGGILEDIIVVEGWPSPVCRYWISL